MLEENVKVNWVEYDCEIIDPIPESELVRHIEQAFRVCYNSTNKMQNESYENSIKFIQEKIKAGHHTPLEHSFIMMRSTIDRGILAELTRHRIGCAFSVESTRYCAYKDSVSCIMPVSLRGNPFHDQKIVFMDSVQESCNQYSRLLKMEVTPQIARGVLPMCLKTEVIHSHNLRELLHILDLRYFGKTGKPHPDMQYWCGIMYKQLQQHYPNIFIDN